MSEPSSDKAGVRLLGKLLGDFEAQQKKPPVVSQAGLPRRAPAPRTRDAKLVAAIALFDRARDAFLALAGDAADFAGDPEYDRAFELASGEADASERILWHLIGGTSMKPVARGGRVYVAEPRGRIRVLEVHRLPEPGPGGRL